MRGQKINNWAKDWLRELTTYVNVGNNLLSKAIWMQFEQQFHTTFTDTTEKQDAFLALQNLQMKDEDVDTYGSSFEHLQRKGWLGAGHIGDNLGIQKQTQNGIAQGNPPICLTPANHNG